MVVIVTAICPSCGYNLIAERPIADGPFSYSPGFGFEINGERLQCQAQIHEMMGAIMLMRGRTVTHQVLAERLGYEGSNPEAIVKVLLCYARKRITSAGHDFPVQTIRSVGMRWKMAA